MSKELAFRENKACKMKMKTASWICLMEGCLFVLRCTGTGLSKNNTNEQYEMCEHYFAKHMCLKIDFVFNTSSGSQPF